MIIALWIIFHIIHFTSSLKRHPLVLFDSASESGDSFTFASGLQSLKLTHVSHFDPTTWM